MANFVGLQTGLTALRAAQYGIDTASHNIANANTPGYTRQRLDLSARPPYQSPVGPLGTGVDVVGIARMRDAFLDARVRTGQAAFGYADARASLLSRAESVLGEPDNGISGQLGELWAAFEDLAVRPDDSATRQQVVSTLGALSARVRAVTTGWDQLADDGRVRLDDRLTEVNDLLERIHTINRTLPVASTGGTPPNDLLDERDKHLDRLAELIGATASTNTDGTVTVTVDGTDLVGPGYLREITADDDAALTATTIGGVGPAPDPAPVDARAELGAIIEFVTVDLPGRQAALDEWVEALAGALADVHAEGMTADGDPGGPLLVFDPGAPARSLQVDPDLAADPRLLATGPSGQPHDGRTAQALADLRTTTVGDATLDRSYARIVVDLASSVAESRRAAQAQHSLTTSALTARESVHGVSVDEELVALIQFQRSLEAASRVMTTIDQALDTLVNRTGIVGR